jgi:hypothetical protein
MGYPPNKGAARASTTVGKLGCAAPNCRIRELCPARHALSAVSVRRPLAYLSYGPAWFLGDGVKY